jgi:hypothetical protein
LQLSLQPQLPPQPQFPPQLLPPQEPPQQQHRTMTMRMSHRQEQLLFPLLKHIVVTSL